MSYMQDELTKIVGLSDNSKAERPTMWLDVIEFHVHRWKEDEICPSFIDQTFQKPTAFNLVNCAQHTVAMKSR